MFKPIKLPSVPPKCGLNLANRSFIISSRVLVERYFRTRALIKFNNLTHVHAVILVETWGFVNTQILKDLHFKLM